MGKTAVNTNYCREGVDRIYRDMAEAGLPEPKYRQSEFMLYATLKNKNWGKEEASWVVTTHDTTQDARAQDRAQDTAQDGAQDKIKEIIDFCEQPRSKQEIIEHLGFSSIRHFNERYIKKLLKSGQLVMTIPDKPNSKKPKVREKYKYVSISGAAKVAFFLCEL